jgi:dTDP-6-deoxy-L-talose 4-dehydrogenase (NAD+)
MKIAIIGGSGFVGQNLITYFLKKNIRIFATYNSNNKIKNKFSNVIWRKLDIKKDKKNFFKYLGSPDIVLNLAWSDIPNYNLKKQFKNLFYQKKFNYNLIKNGLKNLIILGTCYEYGNVTGRVTEDTKEKPVTPYAISKLRLLKSILKLKNKKNFKFTWLRAFFVYGINKKRQTLFSLINNLEKRKIDKLKVCGNLVRDFVSINFLCSVLAKVTLLDKDLGILNVSSGKGILLQDFIKKILKNKKNLKKINMNGKNPNSFEPKSFWCDNAKLKKVLNKLNYNI